MFPVMQHRTMTPRQVGGVLTAGRQQTFPTHHVSTNNLGTSYKTHVTNNLLGILGVFCLAV